jgi:hypothetical protein
MKKEILSKRELWGMMKQLEGGNVIIGNSNFSHGVFAMLQKAKDNEPLESFNDLQRETIEEMENHSIYHVEYLLGKIEALTFLKKFYIEPSSTKDPTKNIAYCLKNWFGG